MLILSSCSVYIEYSLKTLGSARWGAYWGFEIQYPHSMNILILYYIIIYLYLYVI